VTVLAAFRSLRLWRRTGPGGLRGLQILLPGARTARGGFDSHTSPPRFRVLVAALVLFLIVPAVPAGTGAEPLYGKGPSPGSVALRSLVLPGWGQAANGRWIKAAIAFGAYGGFWAWAVSLNQDKQDATGSLHTAASLSDSLYWVSEVRRLKDGRNAKFWFAGLTLLLSITDAYVDAHLRGFDDRIDAKVGWIPSGSDGDAILGVRVTAALDDGGSQGR
jgi:hypothetical protein